MDKIILVNPSAGSNRDIPNIGLAYIGTILGAKVIDLNTRFQDKNRFLEFKAETLGLSVQSRTFRESLRLARLYKAKYKAAQVKSVSGILDIQCCYPYLKLEDDMFFNQEFCDSLPWPDYELLDSFSIFQKHWQEGSWNYAIMTSQGCPYQCIYCSSRQRPYKARSAKNCCEELKRAKEKWQIKSFGILDDCFNVDKKRVMEFCALVRPLGLSWICANGLRADRFDEETAGTLKEAGCNYLSFGIESAVAEVLEAVKKGENIEQIEEAVDIAKRYGFGVNGFFIIGLPRSTYERDLYSLRWAQSKGINAHFSYYIPYDDLTKEDYLFYGEDARPVSKEYPLMLQRRIYALTSHMRPERRRSGWLASGLKQVLNKINLTNNAVYLF